MGPQTHPGMDAAPGKDEKKFRFYYNWRKTRVVKERSNINSFWSNLVLFVFTSEYPILRLTELAVDSDECLCSMFGTILRMYYTEHCFRVSWMATSVAEESLARGDSSKNYTEE